jgi:hypothetical protein
VEGIDIMQISGHTNVAFINNYSTFSEERHKKISNILNNTETNRNDLFQQTELIHRNVFTNAVKQYKAQLWGFVYKFTFSVLTWRTAP